jgi:hypothetical protein
MMRSAFGEYGSGDGGKQGHNPSTKPPSGNPCLLVGSDGACVGGARRTSGLYDAISGFAMLFLGVGAGFSFALSQPDGERTDFRWLAVSGAALVGCCLFTVAAITGKVWLFGL